MMKKAMTFLVAVLGLAAAASAGEFAGITPGDSTRADLLRALGDPIVPVGDAPNESFLTFDGAAFGARSIQALVSEDDVIQGIGILPEPRPLREEAIDWLGLPRRGVMVPEEEPPLELFAAAGIGLKVEDDRVLEIWHVDSAILGDSVRFARCRALAEDDVDALLLASRAVCVIDPHDASCRFELTELLLEQGRPAEALEVVRDGRRLAPDDERGPLLEPLAEAAIALQPPLPGWLGLHLVGLEVVEVFSDTPAAAAGVKCGDLVRGLDGPLPVGLDDFLFALAAVRPGRTVTLELARGEEVHSVRLEPIDRREWFAEREVPVPWTRRIAFLVERGSVIPAHLELVEILDDDSRTPVERARARIELAILRERGGIAEALDEWRRLRDEEPEAPVRWRELATRRIEELEAIWVSYGKATELWRENHVEEALEAARLVPPVFCGGPAFLEALCLERTGDPAGAVEAARRSLAIWPDAYPCFELLSRIDEAWDIDRARAACLTFDRLTAGLTSASKEKDRARIRARRERLESAAALLAFAHTDARLGRVGEAVRRLDQANTLLPGNAQLLLARVRLLLKSGGASPQVFEDLEAVRALGIAPLDTDLAHLEARARANR